MLDAAVISPLLRLSSLVIPLMTENDRKRATRRRMR